MHKRLTTICLIIGAAVLTSAANAQSTTGDKWARLLSYSLAVTVPPITISREDDDAYRTEDLTKKKYLGDAVSLSVVGETERYSYNRDVNQYASVKRYFTYFAKYADFGVVEIKDASQFASFIAGTDYRNTAVVINCSHNRNCVEHMVKGQDCDSNLVKSNGCAGPIVTNTRLIPYMTLNFANEATAQDARDAIEELIRINGGDVSVQPSPEVSRRDASRTSGNFRVRLNVSDGIQNMRSGPGQGHPVVVAIPAGSGGITLGDCRRPDDGRSKYDWCSISWNGKSGWVSRNGLEASPR